MRDKKGELSSGLVRLGLQPWHGLMDHEARAAADPDMGRVIAENSDEDVDAYESEDLWDSPPPPISDTDTDNDQPELNRDRRRRRKKRSQLKLQRLRTLKREERLRRKRETERLQSLQYRQILDELRDGNSHVPEYETGTDLATLRYAVQKYSGHKAMHDKVAQFKLILTGIAQFIEFAAGFTKGFAQLKGLGNRFRAQLDLPQNQNALAQMSRKYVRFGSIPPELLLASMFLASAREIHVSNTTGKALEAVAQPSIHDSHKPQNEGGEMSGLGSLVGSAMSMMGGGGGGGGRGGGGGSDGGDGGDGGGLGGLLSSAMSLFGMPSAARAQTEDRSASSRNHGAARAQSASGAAGGSAGTVVTSAATEAATATPAARTTEQSASRYAHTTNAERRVASLLDDDNDDDHDVPVGSAASNQPLGVIEDD